MKDKQQLRVDMGIEVIGYDHIGLLDGFIDIDSIDKKIAAYVKSILSRINIEELIEEKWRVFCINYYSGEDYPYAYRIVIGKFFWRYPEYDQYAVDIDIPIPDNTHVPYGIPPGKYEKIDDIPSGIGEIDETTGCININPENSKYLYLLNPEYDQYDNLEQYIIASIIKAIDFGLTKGFTYCDKKIKFQDL